MKKLSLYLSAIIGFALVSIGCHESPIGDTFAENQYGAKGAVVLATNVVNGFFDLGDPDNAVIAFDLVSEGEAVTGVGINVSYEGGGEIAFRTGTVPQTINVTMAEILAGIGKTLDDIGIGDEVTFTFDVTSSSGNYKSNETLVVPFTCFSDLGGTYDFVSTNFQAITGSCPTEPVTGQVTWEDLGGGKYHTSDLGFGQYGTTCWDDSPATSGDATFTDVCNQIISGGLDQYSLTYTYVITDVSGPDLSISWFNDYDDSGDVVITRPDGSDWPPLYTN